MSDNASGTSLVPMLIAAVEHRDERGVLTDELAAQMLPPALRTPLALPRVRHWLRTSFEPRSPGIWDSLACRKRYFDDRTSAALDDGIEALVVLGAGLDTRSVRLAAPAGVPAYEVDVPSVLARKQRRIQLPSTVIPVPADLETEQLSSVLAAAGYAKSSRTLFLWEGVTQYLTETAVRSTLEALGDAPKGSVLTFSYVRREFLDGTDFYGSEPTYRMFVERRALWQFGLRPPEVATLLADYGWQEREQAGAAEYTARYLDPVGRAGSVTDLERCVLAQKL